MPRELRRYHPPRSARTGAVGDTVRFMAAGGKIPAHRVGHTGVIVRFTKSGSPVVVDDYDGAEITVTRSSGTTFLTDHNGNLVRKEVML